MINFARKKILLLLLLFLLSTKTSHADIMAKLELQKQYAIHCYLSSDINEHLPVLRQLATECSSVMEIGIRSIVSTWGVLQGLSESSANNLCYLGVDLDQPPLHQLNVVKSLAEQNNIAFQFLQANDMEIKIEEIPMVDFLFIDSLHTYAHLTYELEKFSSNVGKYIAMHDTSAPWGDCDDDQYYGDYSEYSAPIDRTKRGLWLAVEDFLKTHPEWVLHERHLNNHGLTVLKRISNATKD